MGLACLFGHKWHGCRCVRCGITRNEQHNWNGCVCTQCGARRNESHHWNGCTCSRCGATRDEQHEWDICKCKICGKPSDDFARHQWKVVGNIPYSDQRVGHISTSPRKPLTIRCVHCDERKYFTSGKICLYCYTSGIFTMEYGDEDIASTVKSRHFRCEACGRISSYEINDSV